MKIKLIAVFLIMYCCDDSLAASLKIPPGFEILARGQQELVDVIYAGKHVGRFDATINLESVRFSEPDKVLQAIEIPLKTTDKKYQDLLKTLETPLPRNGESSCGYLNKTPGCGYLKTDSVALIYDESEDSVTLFLSKELLPNDSAEVRYLSPATQGVENALINEQNLNVVAQDDYKALNLQGASSLGITENSYIGAHWSFDASQNDDESENNTDVGDLYYRYDINRRFYSQVGRMDNRTLFNAQGGNFTFTFLPLGAIDGVRAGSTLSYLNREQASQGSPVTVLLSRNSRVDAYRNGQLLGSFYLAAGNQNIDTSTFPNGSYGVQLRIYESNQLVRTETTAFTKTGSLSDGHFQWFVQGGRISEGSDEEQNRSAFQAGVRIPLFDLLDSSVGVASVSDKESVEAGLNFSPDFGHFGSLGMLTNIYQGEDNSHGDSEQINYSNGNLPSLSLYRYKVSGDQCDDTQNYDSNEYDALGCYESINATATYRVLSWNVILGYMQTQNNADTRTDYQSDRSFEDNLLNETTENATSRTYQLSGSRSFAFDNWMLNSTIGAFHRNDDGYSDSDNGMYISLSFSETPRQNSSGKSHSTDLDASYRTSETDGDQTSYSVSHTWYSDQNSHRELELKAGGLNTDTVDTAATGRVDGRYGNLSGTLSDSYQTRENDHTAAFSGSYSSSVALSQHGIYWGGEGFGEPAAGVIVKIDDMNEEDSNAAVDAQVSGSRIAHIKSGSSAMFPMSGFEENSVEIRDTSVVSASGSTTDVLTGAGSRDILLLPGKLSRRSVAVEHSYNYMGTLRLPDASKASLIQGLNTRMLLLSDDGGFTAEMRSAAGVMYLLSGKDVYSCPLNVKKQHTIVRFVGISACQSIALQTLPDSVREQAAIKLKKANEMETALNP